MKWFWSILALLSAALAAWFIWSARQAPPPIAPPEISALDAPASPAIAEAPAADGMGEPRGTERPRGSDSEEKARDAGDPAPPSGAAAAPSGAAEEWLRNFNAMLAADDAAAKGKADAGSASPAEGADPGAPSGGTPKWGEVVPARKSIQPDGTILFDERFTLAGKGTKDDPYVVNWDYLVSASETYQPRLGKNRLPERVTVLHDKWVRVVGYVAFPILSTSPNEMLSMRNMWDGCCIGVPPTPYDAIEVRLKEGASPAERLMRFGTVEGKLSVDPYVKGNWLLGLYVMDEAKVSEAKNAGL